MSNSNIGNQRINFRYKEPIPVQADNVNYWFHNILRAGVYDGGKINILTDILINIEPISVLIETPTKQLIKVQTLSTIELNINYTTPFIVCSFNWLNKENTYMDVEVKNRNSITAHDVIIAKAEFVGTQIIGINYNWQSRAGLLTDKMTVAPLVFEYTDEWTSYNYPITLTSWTPETEIWYTIDGTTPIMNGTTSLFYRDGIPVTIDNQVIKAIAYKDSMLASNVVEKTFKLPTKPSVNKEQGWISYNDTISLFTITIDGEVYYTTDGTSPTIDSPKFINPISILQTTIVKAITIYKDIYYSQENVIEYKVPEMPIYEIEGVQNNSVIEVGDKVILTSNTGEAQIYYTLNGDTPTSASSLYSEPIEILSTIDLTIKATAIVNVDSIEYLSNIMVTDFSIIAVPSVDISAGWVNYNQLVELSTTTLNSEICYTLNGSNPVRNGENSFLYTTPIHVIQTCTLKAVTIKQEIYYSSVLSVLYNVVNTPSITPTSPIRLGEYVTLTTPIQDAVIYYTLDGTTPTDLSIEYIEPFVLDTIGQTTVKTIAIYNNYVSAISYLIYNVIGYDAYGLITLDGLNLGYTPEDINIQLKQNLVNIGNIVNPDEDGYYIISNLPNGDNYKISFNVTDWSEIYSDIFSVEDDDYGVENKIYLLGRFVSISSAQVLFSNDGTVWNTNAIALYNTFKLAYGDKKFVAMGTVSAALCYSLNGVVWSTFTTGHTLPCINIVYSGGKFVSLSGGTEVGCSTNGITWDIRSLPANKNWSDVVRGSNKYIAVNNSDGVTAYSFDGLTWAAGDNLPNAANCIEYGNNILVVAHVNLDAISYSTDNGVTWTSIPLNIFSASASWTHLKYANNMFVLLSNDNYYAYSEDGINWDGDELNTFINCKGLDYGNGKFVAISNNNKYIESIDGITWVEKTLPIGAWNNLCYGS